MPLKLRGLLLLVIVLTLSIISNGILIYYFLSRERGFMSYRHRQEIRWQIKKITGQKGWLIFLGDSITDRNDWVSAYQDKAVINLGKGGDTTAGLLTRINDLVQLQPKKIFLLIGINDIRYGLKQKEILENYTLLIKTIREQSPHSELYVQSILPIIEMSGESQNATNQRIISLNQSLKYLANTYEIQFIDLHDFFTFYGQLNPAYTDDGLHLNDRGYRLWERIIQGFVYPEGNEPLHIS